jgi:hypothetical protein
MLRPTGLARIIADAAINLQRYAATRYKREKVTAVELSPEERVAFFRDVLAPLARSMPVAAWIVRNVDRLDIDHPEVAAQGRFVFELRAR